MILFNEKQLKEINEDKGSVHTVTYMKSIGYKLKESQQNGDQFMGKFITRNHCMTVITYKDKITYMKLV